MITTTSRLPTRRSLRPPPGLTSVCTCHLLRGCNGAGAFDAASQISTAFWHGLAEVLPTARIRRRFCPSDSRRGATATWSGSRVGPVTGDGGSLTVTYNYPAGEGLPRTMSCRGSVAAELGIP